MIAVIRPAIIEDAPAVQALTRDAYAKWVPVIGREPKPMSADYEAAIRHHRIDLLHIEDRLVALVETIPEPDHLLIENLAVSPAFQHRGVGRQLLAHVELAAAAQGYPTIRLYTNKLFATNVLFYRRLGYAIDREEASHRGVIVYMSKPIPPER